MSVRFSNIAGLVFDFDGTLVDASIPICISFNAALERFGEQPVEEGRIRSLIGHPLRDMYPAVLPDCSATDIEQLIEFYREAFLPISGALSKPMPGTPEMLAHFRPLLQMGIATSRITDGAERILGAMNLLDVFEVIVGLDDVENPKPHPEPVLKALDAMNVAPQQAIMIGDVPGDMLAGKAAGCATIGVLFDATTESALRDAGADTVISDLREIIPMIACAAHPLQVS